MDPDLVGAAGGRAELDEGLTLSLGDLAPPRRGLLASLFDHHPPAALGAGHFGDRKVDQPLLTLDRAIEHREIAFRHRAALERLLELCSRARVAGEQQAD